MKLRFLLVSALLLITTVEAREDKKFCLECESVCLKEGGKWSYSRECLSCESNKCPTNLNHVWVIPCEPAYAQFLEGVGKYMRDHCKETLENGSLGRDCLSQMLEIKAAHMDVLKKSNCPAVALTRVQKGIIREKNLTPVRNIASTKDHGNLFVGGMAPKDVSVVMASNYKKVCGEFEHNECFNRVVRPKTIDKAVATYNRDHPDRAYELKRIKAEIYPQEKRD